MAVNGELKINNKVARTVYGIVFDDSGLCSLLTPPSTKEYVSNSSRLSDGRRYPITSSLISDKSKYVKAEAKDVTLTFSMCAKDHTELLVKYKKFCNEVLAYGEFTISSTLVGEHKLLYQACNQFQTLFNGIAKFSLKATEYAPKIKNT